MTFFGYVMCIAFLLAIISLIFGLISFLDSDDATVPFTIVGLIFLAIFILQTQIVHTNEVIFYGDEYDINNIKEELDAKGIIGKDEQISITDREYIKTYYSRFNGCTYYEYAVHPGDIQIDDFEKYKK